MVKKKPIFKVERFDTSNKRWYLWKEDRRATTSGGWRLLEILSTKELTKFFKKWL